MTTKKESPQELLPEVRKVTVGIRDVRTVNQYPLSLHDQFELADQITEVLSRVMELESSGVLKKSDENDDESNEGTMEIIQSLLSTLSHNIPYILDKIFDDVTANDVTNNQMIEIAHNIYEVNYATLSKNLKDLFKTKKIQNQNQNQIQ